MVLELIVSYQKENKFQEVEMFLDDDYIETYLAENPAKLAEMLQKENNNLEVNLVGYPID